jgi:hypothetical protein
MAQPTSSCTLANRLCNGGRPDYLTLSPIIYGHVPRAKASGLVRGRSALGVTRGARTQTYGRVTEWLATTPPHGYGGDR